MKYAFLILYKEIKYFFLRKAMIKWYISIILMNVIFVILPKFMPIEINEIGWSFIMMTFSVLLVPNTLTLDLIGGEKYHKTLETIISTPISVRGMLYGKTIFILGLGSAALAIISCIDFFSLKAIYKISIFDSGISSSDLLLFYAVIINAILVIAIVGEVLALIISNLKGCGYILTIVNLLILKYVFNSISDIKFDSMKAKCVLLIIINAILLTVVTAKISKKRVMKCVR